MLSENTIKYSVEEFKELNSDKISLLISEINTEKQINFLSISSRASKASVISYGDMKKVFKIVSETKITGLYLDYMDESATRYFVNKKSIVSELEYLAIHCRDFSYQGFSNIIKSLDKSKLKVLSINYTNAENGFLKQLNEFLKDNNYLRELNISMDPNNFCEQNDLSNCYKKHYESLCSIIPNLITMDSLQKISFMPMDHESADLMLDLISENNNIKFIDIPKPYDFFSKKFSRDYDDFAKNLILEIKESSSDNGVLYIENYLSIEKRTPRYDNIEKLIKLTCDKEYQDYSDENLSNIQKEEKAIRFLFENMKEMKDSFACTEDDYNIFLGRIDSLQVVATGLESDYNSDVYHTEL